MPNNAAVVTTLALVARVLLLRKYPLVARPGIHGTAEIIDPIPTHPSISRYGWLKLTVIIVLTLLAIAAALIYNDLRLDAEQRRAAVSLTGGNPSAAPALIIRFGCAGCHSISGVPEAAGQIGPSLNNLARQGYVGGVVQNTTENLVNWIVDPRAIDPMSAMPRTGITHNQARDVAAYLLSLRG
jgi:cytochrome c1